MIRAGLPLDGELLALAAASHSGEDFHVQGVHDILDFAGLTDGRPALPGLAAAATSRPRGG